MRENETGEARPSFARELTRAREARNVSQAAVADACHLRQASVSSWETGKSTPQEPFDVFAIEQFLRLAPGHLSGLLGYVPADAPVLPRDAAYWIERDPELNADSRGLVLALLNGLRKPRRRSSR